MLYEIKSWLDKKVLFSLECGSLKLCVEAAVKQKVSLSYANLSDSNLSGSNLSDSNLSDSNLSGSDLRGSNLSGSDLRGSNLRGSNLRGSNLSGSNLSDSNLSGSDLSGSNLSDSNLSDSNLSGSDLRGSNLSGSDLRGSNLSGSDLRGSDLTIIRDDFWAVLSAAPGEVDGLRDAIVSGKVDGSVYSGECACLLGTIAKIRHCDVHNLGVLKPNSSRPIESFFLALRPGDTPDKSQQATIVLGWLDEWRDRMRAAFGVGAPAASI